MSDQDIDVADMAVAVSSTYSPPIRVTTADDAPQQPPLLRLPREVRDKIWAEAVTSRDANGERVPLTLEIIRSNRSPLRPTTTCRLMLREMRPLFYTNNVFTIPSFIYRDQPAIGIDGTREAGQPEDFLPNYPEMKQYCKCSHFAPSWRRRDGGPDFSLAIGLPPVSLRPTIKSLEMRLLKPNDLMQWKISGKDRARVELEWLAPVVLFAKLGFCQVEELVVVVGYGSGSGIQEAEAMQKQVLECVELSKGMPKKLLVRVRGFGLDKVVNTEK